MDYTGLLDTVLRAYLKPATAPERMVTGLLGAPDMVKGMAQSAYSGATLPGDVVTGKADPTSPEGFSRVQDLAGLLGGGGYATEKPAGAIGMFAGRSAKTADLGALAQAEKMAAAGESKVSIRDATGWFRGKDGQWRFEIPDNEASLYGYIAPGAMYGGRFDGLLKHQQLFDAYPDLAEIWAGYGGRGQGSRGAYIQPLLGEEQIQIYKSSPDALSTALHEAQHAIQQREGFAPGANVSQFEGVYDHVPDAQVIRTLMNRRSLQPSDAIKTFEGIVGRPASMQSKDLASSVTQDVFKIPASAEQAYRWSAGEVEARNVQKRMRMTPYERREIDPWLTEDVTPDLQIVLQR